MKYERKLINSIQNLAKIRDLKSVKMRSITVILGLSDIFVAPYLKFGTFLIPIEVMIPFQPS